MSTTSRYRAGFARVPITTFVDGMCLFGWGHPKNVARGVKEPLFARAVVLEDRHTSRRSAYVCCDLGMISESVRTYVVERVTRGPLALSEADVMLTATHTHSGPSGFSTYLFFASTGPGFSRHVHDTIVDGIVVTAQSLVRHGLSAHRESRARGTRKARTAAGGR